MKKPTKPKRKVEGVRADAAYIFAHLSMLAAGWKIAAQDEYTPMGRKALRRCACDLEHELTELKAARRTK